MVVASCCEGEARAELGWGLGPVVAITASDTPSLGWELSLVGSNPVSERAALGGNYSWAVQGDDPAVIHYVYLTPKLWRRNGWRFNS